MNTFSRNVLPKKKILLLYLYIKLHQIDELMYTVLDILVRKALLAFVCQISLRRKKP